MGRLRTNVDAPKLIRNFKNFVDLDDFHFSKKPIIFEIGSGKGDFLIQQATINKNLIFIGVEKYATVILKALKKIERNNLKLNNLFFACQDINLIDKKKFKHKIDKIYLNFSDPWPKKRHEKRRLTSNTFLDLYKEILKKQAIVELKTDNDGLYEYTLSILKSRKDIDILYHTNDLYKNLLNKFNKHNIQTEYEKKFVKLSKSIKKIIWGYKNEKHC